jgi:hypothetical protein
MSKVPEPLVRCDQRVLVPSPLAAAQRARSPLGCNHCLQDLQKTLRDLEIRLVAGLMEGDQDLVGQPAARGAVIAIVSSVTWFIVPPTLAEPAPTLIIPGKRCTCL